jgi:hypothetical protein
MLTVAHRVESGGRGEDRLAVEHCGSRTLAIVADGAGGMGGGAIAAEKACSLAVELMRSGSGSVVDWERYLFELDWVLVQQASGGQCTAVVVEISEGRIGVPSRKGILRTIAAMHHQRNHRVMSTSDGNFPPQEFKSGDTITITYLAVPGVRNAPNLEAIPYCRR